MCNKAQNLLDSIKLNCNNAIIEEINGSFIDIDKATEEEQGIALKTCIRTLADNNVDVKSIMRNCNCLSTSVIKIAKKCYDEANGDISECLKLLNDNDIGGGQLHISEKGNIIGIYNHCYCSIPQVIKDMPSSYCECSAGWFEKLFKNILERDVKVNIVHTILDGNDDCVFEIII